MNKRRDAVTMTLKDRIRDQLDRAFDGDPWCGPSLLSVLDGVTAEQATRRIPGLAHSIWDIVLHISGWQGVVAGRIMGEPIAEPPEGDWPKADDSSDSAWRQASETLRATHDCLVAALDSLDESCLDQKIGDSRDPTMGSGMTIYANLHGIAQHAMYHAGQIVLLKKLVASG
jgi:uncharacterized damage-inducible protein DinB